MTQNTKQGVVEMFYLKLKSFRIGQVDRVRTKSKWDRTKRKFSIKLKIFQHGEEEKRTVEKRESRKNAKKHNSLLK